MMCLCKSQSSRSFFTWIVVDNAEARNINTARLSRNNKIIKCRHMKSSSYSMVTVVGSGPYEVKEGAEIDFIYGE